MTEKYITKRMQIRAQALVAVKHAMLPGFCHGIDCEHCSLYEEGLISNCQWLNIVNLLTDLSDDIEASEVE